MLPPPSRIVSQGVVIVTHSDWWFSLMRTLGVTLLGFGLGSVLAILLGLVLGQSSRISRLVAPSLLAWIFAPRIVLTIH